jgi:diacylglycerol kinase family enzyme
VTVIPVLPTLDLLAAGLNYAVGVSSGGDRIENFRSRRVRVSSKPEMLFSIDGEPIREVEATFEVLPLALRIVAGTQAPAVSNVSPAAAIGLPQGQASGSSIDAPR